MNDLDQLKLDHAHLGERIAALEARSRQTVIEIPSRKIILRAGERYAGILRGLNGEPDVDLFLLPDAAESDDARQVRAAIDLIVGVRG